jgi:hypothetical protein
MLTQAHGPSFDRVFRHLELFISQERAKYDPDHCENFRALALQRRAVEEGRVYGVQLRWPIARREEASQP